MGSFKEEIIRLRKDGLTYDEIVKTLGCAKSTVSYHCSHGDISDMVGNKKPTNNEIIEFQKLYDELLSLNKVAKKTGWSKTTILKYVVTKRREKLTDNKLKENRKIAVINWRKRTKQKLAEYKGGSCEVCGYNKCIDALEFHHKDPKEKDFSISHRGNIHNYERLISEVDKCLLVCSNCHREIHYELKKKTESF